MTINKETPIINVYYALADIEDCGDPDAKFWYAYLMALKDNELLSYDSLADHQIDKIMEVLGGDL